MGRVAGKAALVVGAGGGIGGAGAEGLAREGATVFCTDSDGAAAEATSARIRAAGGRAATLATVRRSMRPWPLSCANSAGSISCSNRPGLATGSDF
jgi:NAD(P)-dependent dehydrogenase (short-subunit alcohol dehydrogenase family)